jgi:hypothetical protein
LTRFKEAQKTKENKHVFFDEDGDPVTSSVLEKTKEFLESAQTEETEKVEDGKGGKRDEGHEDDEEFLTADERSTEEEEDDFYDTREQEVSFENIQVCFLKQFLVGGNIRFLFGHIVC